MCAVSDVDEPTFYEEVFASSDRDQWMPIMKEEKDSMTENEMWELIDLPPN